MKKHTLVCIALMAVILFGANLQSQPLPKRSIQMNENQITESLLMGLNSPNEGLCASSVYIMGELCCNKGVIKLMSLLHNAECEEIRILAALSLCKIGDSRGVFAVKRSAIFDESERVKRLCALFYKAYISGKIPESEFKFKS